jgi:hypothetical protein
MMKVKSQKYHFLAIFSSLHMKENSQKFFGKVFLKFENGHLFLSIFRSPKKSLLTKFFVTIKKNYRHNLNDDKIFVTVIFFIFF